MDTTWTQGERNVSALNIPKPGELDHDMPVDAGFAPLQPELHVVPELPDDDWIEPQTAVRGTGMSGGLSTASTRQRAIKRALDIVGAVALLVVLSPLMLLVALVVACTSRGPILYHQPRVGRGGKVFDFYKFRTMYRDADARRWELSEENEADGPVFKIRQDPRITPVGRILRKLSIDELPQLVSVLNGTMSLVGPRPPLPAEVEHYSVRERQRLSVKPGLTCIWQVSGRSDIGFEEWVEMDLDYISGWTPSMDVRILLLTIPAVLLGRGAY